MSPHDIEKQTQKPVPGLYLVATPIGNLGDMTLRALEMLKGADLVLCEDTRVTRKLLSVFGIKAKTRPYNDHSEERLRGEITDLIENGQAVALVSDAGMPLVSDPGYKLVQICRERGLYVTSLPGANAPLAALQLSGFPSDSFAFTGFLPVKKTARQKILGQWKAVQTTLIAFETAPRLLAALEDIAQVMEKREVAVVREITKMYEEVRRGDVEDLCAYYQENGAPKGEIVLVIAPPGVQKVDRAMLEEMLREAMKTMRTKDAAAYVAERSGASKKELYTMALGIGA